MLNLSFLYRRARMMVFIFLPIFLLGLAVSFFAENTQAGNITFRTPSTAGSADATGTSIVVDKPAVVEDGDVLIAQVGSFHSSGHIPTWSAPEGWELIHARTNTGTQHYAFFYKVVTDASLEPATYTFSKTGLAGALAAIIVPAVGVDNESVIDAEATATAATSGTMTFTTLTTQTEGAVYVGVATIRRKQNVTYQGDITAIASAQGTSGSVSTDVTVSMGYLSVDDVGAVSEQSATLNLSTQSWYTYAFALKPTTLEGSPPPVITITSDPSTITETGTSTISWSVTGADTCTASGTWSGAKDVSGSEEVSPETTSTYTLTCTGEGGESEESATVTVNSDEPDTCESVTQYGITWTFDGEYSCGTFANGDWWVDGPVTITSITPAPADGRNGWEINPTPGNSQPYDSRITNYSAALQPELPALVSPGSSVASTVSTIDGSDCRPCLQTAAILTVLDTVPPENGENLFRPPYTGTDKPSYSIDDLQTEELLSLEPVTDTPSLNTVLQKMAKVQFDHKFEYTGRLMHPKDNMQDYGAGITHDNGRAILRLSLNDTLENKMPLLIATVQAGIDYFGMLENGHRWPANGGHHSGRKIMILFAGLMLGDEEMLDIGEDYLASTNTFAEDAQTFYTFDNPPFADASNAECYQALSEDYLTENGYARYGIRHASQPSNETAHGENSICEGSTSSYWAINSPSWIGQTLSAHLYGLTDEWNHQAYFDHLDRRVAVHGFSGTWGDSFNNSMWLEYRDSIAPPEGSDPDDSDDQTDPDPDPVPGCLDPQATNYNPDATLDDDTCEYVSSPSPPRSSRGSGTIQKNTLPTVPSIVSELVSKIQSLIAELAQTIIFMGGTPSFELSPIATPSVFSFTQDLELHSTGENVMELQKYLNANGFLVASSGPGSPGNETDYFGQATYNALRKFQTSVGLPSTGYFGPMTRGVIEGNQ